MLPGPLKEVLAKLVGEGKAIPLDSRLLIHRDMADAAQRKLLDIIGDFHRGKPESPGLSIEQFHEEHSHEGTKAQRINNSKPSCLSGLVAKEAGRLKKDVFDGLVKLLIAQGKVVERKHRLALPEHREMFSEDQEELIGSIESLFKTRPFDPPSCEEVIQHTAAAPDKVQKTLRILTEQERLVRIDKDLFFHRDAVEEARRILTSYINTEGGLESVKFKYLLNTTRKFAIPLLDYFDRVGVTRRVGYTRYLKSSTVH
jgi:selenocysteine-specific elongation factor